MKISFLDDDIKKVHFIGIGGVSMSGLAEILFYSGYNISGSDRKMSNLTEHLQEIGVKIFDSHNKNNITDDIDLVVYTVAVKEDNEEFIEAKNKNIKIIDRAHLLGLIMKKYKYPICVSGIHGKTTTTSMISEVLLQGYEPTISVGGFLKSINGNFKVGGMDYFVVESCEYFDSFLKFFPYIGIILNIEADHLDYFKDLDHIYSSFNKFAKNIDEKGILIINNTIKELEKVTDNMKCNVLSFGDNDSDYNYSNVTYNKLGCPSFDVIYKNKKLTRINLKVPGDYNIFNSLGAFATCDFLEIPVEKIKTGLENFTGTNRRFQYKGTINNITVVDDYAHHPTEIKATLSAAKKIHANKIWCVFQPHTYTRTKLLFDDFINSFDDADNIIILDIYAAREKDNLGIHSKDLVEALVKRKINAIYINNFDYCVEYLLKNCIHNDLLITMGAGDVYFVGEKLLSQKLSTLSTDFKTS